jgi:hypothetical protein
VFAAGLLLLSVAACGDEPPGFAGVLPPALGPTSFIDPDLLTEADPTAFASIQDDGQGQRTMFDRRVDGDVTVAAWLFTATYDDGLSVEVQVNPEFSDSAAAEIAAKYATTFGRLPHVVRDGIDEIWVHDGAELFGSGTNAVLIHHGEALVYENNGYLEEAILPEAVRATVQQDHGTSAGWREAQELDNRFISQIAEDNPDTEDVAQSFLPWLAVTVLYDEVRITPFLASTIINAIPARLIYLDDQGFDLHPLD